MEEFMEEFVVLSKVRTGHKREFAFALRSQYEIACSLGSTRTRKPVIGFNRVQNSPIQNRKRMKKSGKRIGLVKRKNGKGSGAEGKRRRNGGLVIGQQQRSGSYGEAYDNAVASYSDFETGERTEDDDSTEKLRNVRRKPKKEGLAAGRGGGYGGREVAMAVPTKLKDLLRTGLLEGLAVSYRRSVKRKSSDPVVTRGVVSGSGIRCFCHICNGGANMVVTPNVFEIHAGSRNKRPADNMFMENGNTLRDLLNACINSKFEDLEATIRSVCGQGPAENSLYGVNWNAGSGIVESEASEETPERPTEDSEASEGAFDIAIEAYETSEETPERATDASEISEGTSQPEASEETSERVCNASEETSERICNATEETSKSAAETAYVMPEPVVDKSSSVKSRIKFTRKHLGRHKFMLKDDDVLPNGTEVFYYFQDKVWLSGVKQGTGILCACCEKQVSPSRFEAHAGWAIHRQPYHHIYTSEGKSLLSLARSLPGKQKNLVEEKDELCNVCRLDGYFISCHGCPRVFHKECVHLQEIPDGHWYCRVCRYQRNNVAGTSRNDTAAGVAGIERQSMQLVETEESVRGGCVLCRAYDFSKEGFGSRTILLCDQCEREYHVGCLKEHGIQDLEELPQGNWFCCSGCDRINFTLQQLIDEGVQEIPDPLLNAIKEKHAAKDSEDVNHDVKWRLLSGNMCGVEQLLSDAVSIFQEQFSPIVLPGSKTDLIPYMVFGKNMKKDKDYRGVYCAVLTVNSQVVSAGILRVFGTEIAELPLIATAKYCEKLGYFQALYHCIENLLRKMEVKHLSLPAAIEAKPLWTNKLGFSEFPKNELAEVGKWYQLMPFHGTSMLRKAVARTEEAAATTVMPDRLEWLSLDGEPNLNLKGLNESNFMVLTED